MRTEVSVPRPVMEGLEPRLLLVSVGPVELIAVEDVWRYFKGTAEPPAAWVDAGFDDGGWLSGATGIGYSNDIGYATTLADMAGGYYSFYARRAFTIDDPGNVSLLRLGIVYDDGFIAYLNGAEVARSNSMGAAGEPFDHNDPSDDSHDEEDPEEVYEIVVTPGMLEAGDNVLAIQVHNVALTSTDAGLIPWLVALDNIAPTAAVAVGTYDLADAPVAVGFDGSASGDADGSIVSYAWDFGDGSPAISGPSATSSHTYAANGVYTVTLTVTDDDGDTGEATADLLIGPGRTFYVADPRGPDGVTGGGDDVDASDGYAGTIDHPFATLAKAAATALIGDTVYIRGGTYTNQRLAPAHSGGPGRTITFAAYGDEEVTITGASLDPAIEISGRSYIAIRGIHVVDVYQWLWARDSHYNIIEGCLFDHTNGAGSKSGLFFQAATYNQVLNNEILNCASDSLALHNADRNLIEGNTFIDAGHTLWTIKGGDFNVLRDNYFYNSIQKIGEVYDPWGAGFDHELYELDATKHNLITDNVFAYTASSGNSSPYAGIQYAGQDGIVRRNRFYDTVGPGLDLTAYSDEAMYNTGNRIYNNVFYGTDFAGVSVTSANYTIADNILINNILSGSEFVANDTRWSWYTGTLAGKPVQFMTGRQDGFTFVNNNLDAGAGDEAYLITYGVRTSSSNPAAQTVAWWEANAPSLFADNTTWDPGFVDAVGHDFHLTGDSAMIDTGAFLTTAVGTGSGTLLAVGDASWFYDGYGMAGEEGDLIRLSGGSETARVVGIDYEANVLTLDRSLSWTAGEGVSLAYTGAAPDLGAYEYDGDNDPPTATDDSVTTAEDTAVVTGDVLANDTDPDGQTLSVQSYTQPSHGSASYNGSGRFSYAPASNYNGADSFTYTVTDGAGGTDTATVSVTVTAVNDDPIGTADAYSVDQDEALVVDAAAVVLANDTDVDSAGLTVTVASEPAHGTVSLAGDG
ncbi:MAG TPA: tandem-95 repeat protein, partial [Phycisphaerae bacterium]|nr:tandem-95 repeat protein [Phycisphaerae bacterium]